MDNWIKIAEYDRDYGHTHLDSRDGRGDRMKEHINCSSCGDIIYYDDEYYHILESSSENRISLCDPCFQDMVTIEKRGDGHIEYVLLNGEKYRLIKSI